MQSLFYRQLDILNRVFILNHLDVKLLESPCLAKLDIPLQTNQMNLANYLSLDDITLFIASLPTSIVMRTFRLTFLFLVAQDKSITLNTKILTQLKSYFSAQEFKDFFNYTKTRILNKDLHSILLNSTIDNVIAHIRYLFFYDLYQAISKQIKQRFAVPDINQKLLDSLSAFNIHDVVEKQFSTKFNNTYQAIVKLRRN